MFSGATVSLKEFSGKFGLTVRRDADCAFVGKVPTRLEQRVVPCERPIHIQEAIAENGISGIITTEELASLVPESMGLAISDKPVASALLLHEAFVSISDFQWKSFDSRIHPSSVIHSSAYVAERDVEIAEGVEVMPHAVILPRSIIGNCSKIGPGTVVGTDGFEVNMHAQPRSILRQAGGVKLGSNVEIQAKCTIVRATFGGFTEIGDETKLDCQIHLAHDCRVGKRVRIAACAEISGRVTIDDDAFIGPNVSISNGCVVGARAHVTIGAVSTRNVADNCRVTGHFAVDHRKWLSFMRSVK